MLISFIRTFQNGFKSLMLHKLRAGLAMLGILIGVTAVIWLVALGEGVSYQAQQQIKDLGDKHHHQERQAGERQPEIDGGFLHRIRRHSR